MLALRLIKSIESKVSITILTFVFVFFFWAGAKGQSKHPDAVELERIEQQIVTEKKQGKQLEKKARTIEQELKDISHKMVLVARNVQNYEERLSNLETRISSLKDDKENLKQKLLLRDKQMSSIISALEHIAWKPTEAMILQPLAPVEIVRSIILMRSAIPQIESSAKEIKKDLDDLNRLSAAIQSQHSRISVTREELGVEQKEMNELHTKRIVLKKQVETESRQAIERATKLAAKANDLRELLVSLEAERKKRKTSKVASLTKPKKTKVVATIDKPEKLSGDVSFVKARGRLPMPARGNITTRYGEVTRLGSHAKGITIVTRSEAQVIAPFDGTVLFAGLFRGYGQLLIIEHGEGYHTLLAGMSRIDVNVGQNLLAGEPVGIMPKEKDVGLYVELRKDGQPVNPMPWLAKNNDKVS